MIDPAQLECDTGSHPSRKNKGTARVGHPNLLYSFRAGSIAFHVLFAVLSVFLPCAAVFLAAIPRGLSPFSTGPAGNLHGFLMHRLYNSLE
jgi:hypothetical protein